MKKPSSGGLHLGRRVVGVLLCIGLGILILFAWNNLYHNSGKGTRRSMNYISRTTTNKVPDYHPKKPTKATRKVTSNQAKIKQAINNDNNN